MNFVLAGILLWFVEFKWIETMIYANLLVGFFNLLPIYPLDGGQMLKAILNKRYSSDAIDEIVNTTSNVIMILLTMCASIGILYLKNIAILFIILYLWILRIAENRKHKLKKRVYKILDMEKGKIVTKM